MILRLISGFPEKRCDALRLLTASKAPLEGCHGEVAWRERCWFW